MSCLKRWLYIIAFAASFPVFGGSYDDFFSAISRDDALVIGKLLDRGFDPNTVNPKGVPALIVAISEPAPKVVAKLLSDQRTRIEAHNAENESPLMLAALKGRLEICKDLIARDADVNRPGWTPLHYAATGGHIEVMQLLLDHHAYIDASSPNGSTPLMMAAMYGTDNAVKLLIEAGADITVRNSLGFSALDFAKQAQREFAASLIQNALQLVNQTPTNESMY